MTGRVTGIAVRYKTSGTRYLWASLDCGAGHGATADYRFVPGTAKPLPDLYVGDVVECEYCAQAARRRAHYDANVLRLLEASIYTRHRGSSIYFYERDEASPTGMRLLGEVSDEFYDEFCALARSYRRSGSTPLSPIEGMTRFAGAR